MQWERHVKSVMGEEGGVDDIVSQERAEAAMYDHLYCEGREVQFYAMERMDYEMQLVDAERSGEATYSYDTPHDVDEFEPGEAEAYAIIAEVEEWRNRCLTEERAAFPVGYALHVEQVVEAEVPGEEARWEDGEAEYYSKVAEEIAKSNRVVTEPVMHQQHHQGRTVEVERVGDRSSNSGFSEKVNNEVLVDKRIPTEGGKNRSDEAMQYRLWVDEFRMSV